MRRYNMSVLSGALSDRLNSVTSPSSDGSADGGPYFVASSSVRSSLASSSSMDGCSIDSCERPLPPLTVTPDDVASFLPSPVLLAKGDRGPLNDMRAA